MSANGASPVWLRRMATLLAVFAVLATTAGVAVLRSGATSEAGPPSPATEFRASVPAEAGEPAAEPDPAPTSRPTGPAEPPPDTPQPPGTVRLADGDTAGLVRTRLTGDGTLPIPPGTADVAWWGAEVGAERGVSLLAGHVGWHGADGSFAALWRHRPGDEVTVRDTADRPWTYRVAAVRTLHKTDLGAHAPDLFRQDGPHRLVLVTCGGDYLGGTDGYSDNLVVTATPVSTP
ncbi:sortase [Saccharomonospora piscinae]|uniref:Sortase n=1 Tax=Saccharomonospora piscinae TaxID=687388 RepID=A0A1V8ZXW7_SACPI|nr:class F sortase [Saccharomonospora piscinae]OQO89616.1 sortase [Saccharomonospora piscinae]